MATDLRKILGNSKLTESENAIDLLASGATVDVHPVASNPSDLHAIYIVRSKHLAQFQSPHAKRLKASVDELCEKLGELEDHQKYRTATIRSRELGAYLVWFTVPVEVVLGCCYTIGKYELSGDAWSNLWNGGAE